MKLAFFAILAFFVYIALSPTSHYQALTPDQSIQAIAVGVIDSEEPKTSEDGFRPRMAKAITGYDRRTMEQRATKAWKPWTWGS